MDYIVAILGSCGSSKDVYCTLQENYPGTPAVFINDLSQCKEGHFVVIGNQKIPIIRNWDFTRIQKQFGLKTVRFLCGLGNTVGKRILVSKALAQGLEPAETLVSKDSVVRPDCFLGRGGVIHLGSYLSTNVNVGDYVSLFSTRVGHDSVISNYCTCTLSNLPGHVYLDEGVQLGVGVSAKERIYVAPWCLVGVQSAVVKDIETPGTVAVGIPARKIRDTVFPRLFLDSWPEGWKQHLQNHRLPRPSFETG